MVPIEGQIHDLGLLATFANQPVTYKLAILGTWQKVKVLAWNSGQRTNLGAIQLCSPSETQCFLAVYP